MGFASIIREDEKPGNLGKIIQQNDGMYSIRSIFEISFDILDM